MAAGIHPTILSHIMCGRIKVRQGDPRVLAVARVLGLDPPTASSKCLAPGTLS